MQPRVSVILAMVCLAMYANMVGTTSHHPSRLTRDQYSPLAPHRRHHRVYRGTQEELDWKDQNHAENQPFDRSIGPRRLISMNVIGTREQSYGSEYLGKDTTFRRIGNNVDDDYSALVKDNHMPHKFASREFADRTVDNRSATDLESASRELPPPSASENPLAADGTMFQDQGPGSLEIYKLDLLGDKSILSPTPIVRFLSQAKGKSSKKTTIANHSNWKAKIMEYKGIISSKTLHKQSNLFDDTSTEIPPNNESFGIGGVPELQVGCEGLEAADHDKQKRSIDRPPSRDKNSREIDRWIDVTPIALDLDYNLSGEEGYEEMDELVKLKKFETSTKSIKSNRGDMEATLHSQFFHEKKGSEKLPIRGDLGKSSVNSSVLPVMIGHDAVKTREKVAQEGLHGGERDLMDGTNLSDRVSRDTDQRGMILRFDDSDIGVPLENKKRRSKRGIWGFAEDEGVVSSNELQTANQRRRQEHERHVKKDEERRLEQLRRRDNETWRYNYIGNQTNADTEKIREQYERTLEYRQRQEEERQRRLQQKAWNRWQVEEQHRRRKEEEESKRNRWMDDEQRTHEMEASRQRYEFRPRFEVDEQRRIQQEEEIRRREENRLREEEEERRRRMQAEEEDRRRRQREEEARRTYEERKWEWLKRKQEEEMEMKRQRQNENQPSNLVYPRRPTANESGRHDADRRWTEQRERERQRKLNEYVQRNRPINITSPIDEQTEEEKEEGKNDRRRLEEQTHGLEQQRKLQEYIRRNEPEHFSRVNVSHDRHWQEHRRRMDDAKRYESPRSPGSRDGRRNHGPSAPTNIDPQDYVDEARKREAARRIEEETIRERQREQQEQLRREGLRREEEARRMESRRYEEERKRLEAARLAAERRANESRVALGRKSQAGRMQRPLENTRPSYEDRRGLEQHRSRQGTSLIPANLLSNESRRAMDLAERQRQEHERRRLLEAERRRYGDSRAKEELENEHRSRTMKDQWRRQEEARLNALPVSARIIVHPISPSSSPNFESRAGSDIDIDYQGANPYRPGVTMPNFPAMATRHPPVQSPPPCVWAVVHCCTSNVNRLVRCFESNGCPGVNWDPNPCRMSVTQAAREQVTKFYADTEAEERRS